ncbi:MAG: class I SAM-dependent methyltransferase [Ignavibacteriales bacterium]|nr:MAG: class I SAM-dependent methyltransferase [Ignavibacteriaceae bacterium]MBW7872923.1 class I SAM-dependent methyltransferase [Ignavibacteria bacterium]MCZ2142448.1 class I SAM-dependent methyltransferase [Ignavibacteriales bacterium]OQY72951.1 MAG: hypothetical protein B6D45_08555 [Ignavibacteriales bacterium UTCHB3]MBV6445330.1 Ubiquinone/menaquinone biosynthesis C-methyltransferase UbiE [Ignavibacteriaceae bacterium]
MRASESRGRQTEWFTGWFESEHYLKLYSHRDDADAHKLVALLQNNLKLPKNARVLDLACGAARHALIFAGKGYKVTGYDLSSTLLEIGKNAAVSKNVKLDLVRGDIRAFPFHKGYDLVLNIFTSWGYFSNDEQNAEVLRSAISLKKENGYFVLDTMNPRFVQKNLKPFENIVKNGVEYRISKEIADNRVIKRITFNDSGEEYHFLESVRLYNRKDIESFIVNSGVKKLLWFGDYSGGDFREESSPRIICIAS